MDSDCGDDDSGVICEDDVCDFGCRGMGGNGCPDGEMCSSPTDEPGTCEDDVMPPDAGGVTGGSGGSGGSDGGVTGGSGGMSGGEGGESGASGIGATGVLGGGGCDCRAVPGSSRSSDALLMLAAVALLWQRRRR